MDRCGPMWTDVCEYEPLNRLVAWLTDIVYEDDLFSNSQLFRMAHNARNERIVVNMTSLFCYYS